MPPTFRSALLCDHANEMPSLCTCASDCYCKANACSSVARNAVHPPQRRTPLASESDVQRVLGQFPHCDQLVLHKPGDCQYCDDRPEWQALRMLYGMNFTGENDPKKSPCPAEHRRAAYEIHRWGGNRPTNAAAATEARTRFHRELDEEMERLEAEDRQTPETD